MTTKFVAYLYYLTISIGQRFICSLAGSSAPGSFTRLQTRCCPRLESYLKACLGKEPLLDVQRHKTFVAIRHLIAHSKMHSRFNISSWSNGVPNIYSVLVWAVMKLWCQLGMEGFFPVLAPASTFQVVPIPVSLSQFSSPWKFFSPFSRQSLL